MVRMLRASVLASIVCVSFCARGPAGELEIRLKGPRHITLVGAVSRWDADGNPRHAVDGKAKLASPRLDYRATDQGHGDWLCKDLPAGRYDLIVMAAPRLRVEGFIYPPVLEFDEFLKHADGLDAETRATIESDIAQSRHYENKVTPLFMAGNDKYVRVLVQLLRDKPTSYDGEFGQPVATLRHEIWQYTNRYGAWTKEKRTRVVDRLLMGRSELRTWTWVWTPKLGGIDVPEHGRVVVQYTLPSHFPTPTARGLTPMHAP